MALSDAILEKSKYDPSSLRNNYNLTTSRKEKLQIPQQLLGESYSWDAMIDAAADIYSGVRIYIDLLISAC